MIPDRQFDIVIVGAGPAGGLAALTAARAGLRTLVVEKHTTIGEPLCCAEAISLSGLTDNIPLNRDWIAADREGLTICDATSAAFAQNLDWDGLRERVLSSSYAPAPGHARQRARVARHSRPGRLRPPAADSLLPWRLRPWPGGRRMTIASLPLPRM